MTSMTGYYGYEKEKIERCLFQEYIELPFEDTTFKAIKEYDLYLSQVFGNYMELPPVEKDVHMGWFMLTLEAIKIDFDLVSKIEHK